MSKTRDNLSEILNTEYKVNLAMFVTFQTSYLNGENLFNLH